MSAAVRLPPLSRATRARLWISYQRYAAVLLLAPLAALALAAWLTPWWVTALLVLPALAPLRFSLSVAARWPRKLRATQVALWRQRQGQFSPASVRGSCGDPCFRVVAAEILARAGLDRRARRRLIRQFAAELRAEDRLTFVFDRRVDGPLAIAGSHNLPALEDKA